MLIYSTEGTRMSEEINKIVIVGGGSAGWMTAAYLIKAFPEKEIVTIESPDVSIIGVGESTLGGINDFTRFLGIDEKDFLAYTDGSYKMSIKFTDFYMKDAGGFHYPFGHPHIKDIPGGLAAWFHKKALYPETPITDFVNCYFPSAALYEQNKFSLNRYGIFDSYDPDYDVAYHFDATKFGAWLRDRYSIPRGVKLIRGTVRDVIPGENGVGALVLNDGERITADLFIDCTGFRSILLSEFLKEPFVSYKHILPNNRAWATRVPYVNKTRELEPYTNSIAIGHGWVWNIPSWNRLGTGYVYSDEYIEPEDAKEEFKQYLMSDKILYPRTREQVENLEYKDIPIRVGIHERTWVKNVVAIGLSAGFIEPLESNGLYTVHEFLRVLAKTLLRPKVNKLDKDLYCSQTRHMYDGFAHFVSQHYSLSLRDDTNYWKANSERTYDENMINLIPTQSGEYYDMRIRKYRTNESDNIAGITYISVGMNYFYMDRITSELRQLSDRYDHKIAFQDVFNELENRKKRWWKAAEDKPTLHKYLSNNIYEGEM